MNFKPYPEYKDSGVEWIGEIPKGWNIEKLKYNSIINKESLPENKDPGYEFFYLDISNVSNNGRILNVEFMRFEDAPSRARRIPSKHDTIISTVRTYLKSITYLDGIPDDFIVSTGFSVLNPKKNIFPSYLYYLVSSDLFVQTVVAYSKGIAYPAINSSDLANLPIWYPEIETQNKISSFLDKKTSEIDLTIEKDSRLIELLKEKRTALINHVVTKGLDPTAEMKDSGVEWIGEIPEDWKLKRLKYNVLVNPPGKKSISDPKSKINFLPMEKVSEDGSYDLDSKTEYEKVCSGYTYFEDNDVLLAKITPCFENGKGTLVENLDYGFGFGTTEFHVFRSSNEIIPKYLYFLTKSHLFRVTGEAFMEGAAGQKRVSTDFVKNFRMPTPPDNQQYQIIEYLDQKTSEIDLTIQKIQEHIKLLVEYKKSLIHHVVTGKVDVREVAV